MHLTKNTVEQEGICLSPFPFPLLVDFCLGLAPVAHTFLLLVVLTLRLSSVSGSRCASLEILGM